MEAPTTIEVPVTAELLQQKAEQIGSNLKNISATYPKTAGVLLLDSTIVDGQRWNDPDVLTAKQMAQDCEYNNAENSRRIGANLFNQESEVMSPQRINQGLDRLVEIASKTDKESLLDLVNKQIGETRSKLIMDRGASQDEDRYLINRRREQYEAKEELQGK